MLTPLQSHLSPMGQNAFVAQQPSSLLTGLISYWKLDEVSGTRNDSVGANHLTDNNTVTQSAGKIGNAGQFSAASSETLSAASNASLQTGDIDYTIAGWFYLDSTAAAMLAAKDGPAGREWFLYNSGSRFQFWFHNGSGFATATADPAGAPGAGTWYFIVAWHNSVGNSILIQVNNGSPDGVASGGGANTPGADPFILGGRGHADLYFSGRIDEFGFWKRLLTTDEKTELYNGGAGKTHPFT